MLCGVKPSSSPDGVNGVVLSSETRERVGLRLRALRLQQDLKQKHVANRARIATNTLQAIERNRYAVGAALIERVANSLETNLVQLTQEQPEVDPRVAGLTPEDFTVARAFHDATTDVRQVVLAALRDPQPLEPRAALATQITERAMHLPAGDQRPFLELLDQLLAQRALQQEQRPRRRRRPRGQLPASSSTG